MNGCDLETIELDLLLTGVQRRYGHDFSRYNRETVARRVSQHMAQRGIETVSALTAKVLHSREAFSALVHDLSVTVTEMFRDPHFFRVLIDVVIPQLKTHPFVNVWHAGCATGEEVYSLAILLHEAGYLERAHIYATDINDTALARAREGIYPLRDIRQYTQQYQQAGGTESFAQYYHAMYDSVIMDQALKTQVTFANHNLAVDQAFAEMHLIVCRNVLIYFNQELQDRVIGLFQESLCRGGFLALGTTETPSFTSRAEAFETVDARERIYCKRSAAACRSFGASDMSESGL